MEFRTIRYEVADGVATLTLNRPERHNAFDLVMCGELEKAWTRVRHDPGVICVIVTGAGDRAFCTGADVAAVSEQDVSSGAALTPRRDSPWLTLTALQNRCWKPVVTAVNGMCCGGGLHFVADSDLVIASESATFFDTHVKLGLVAGLEPVALARRIPLEAVLRLALLGGSERLDARRALELGLVGEVVPVAQLLPRARELAAKIAEHSPAALSRTKQAIWQSLDLGLEAALDCTWDIIQAHDLHPDPREGTKAFVEKRKPRWTPHSN